MYASGVLLHKKNIQEDCDNLNCKIKCSRKDMQDLASVKKIQCSKNYFILFACLCFSDLM